MTKEEKNREYKRKYYEKNKEDCIERARLWSIENRERDRSNKRRSYEKNYEKNLEHRRIWQAANRGKYLELKKASYQKNIDTYKKWYQDHIRERVEYNKQYRKDNKEQIELYQKIYRDNNKESRNAYNREYYIKNRESEIKRSAIYSKSKKGRLVKQVCDNKRRGAEGSFTTEDIKNLYATQGARCYYCSISIEEGYHIEHMAPISKGGSNWIDNICLACVQCNLSKHDKTAEEFLACSFN